MLPKGILVMFFGLGLAMAAENIPAGKVQFSTPDGYVLKGDFYPTKPNAPVVLLLHKLGSERTEYGEFPRALQKKGINVLAYDARGHGESTAKSGKAVYWKDFTDKDFADMVIDIDSALKFLREKKGLNKSPACIVGASIQSSTALVYAARHTDIKAVVMLSPGLDYHDIDTVEPMKQYGVRPVFIAASEEDGRSVQASRKLDSLAHGKKTLEILNNAGHGASMLKAVPALSERIIDWLSNNL